MTHFELGLDTFGYHNEHEAHLDEGYVNPDRDKTLKGIGLILDQIDEALPKKAPTPREGRVVTIRSIPQVVVPQAGVIHISQGSRRRVQPESLDPLDHTVSV
jgi:hypothetical protein